MPHSLSRSLFFCALSLGGILGAGSALAQGATDPVIPAPALQRPAIDPVTTGAIVPAGPISRQAVEGSLAFRTALQALVAGDPEAAYNAAKGFTDPVERKTIQWAAIRFGDNKVDYQSILRFAKDAPEYDTRALYRTRVEQALLKTDPDDKTVIATLGGHMPETTAGRVALAAAYVKDGQQDRAARIARYVWDNFFLDQKTETQVLSQLGSLLTNADHWTRAQHLLMHDRAQGTERLLNLLTPGQRSLALARIAVVRNASDAGALIDKVDPHYRETPLFWFTRAQFARRAGALSTALDFLDKIGGTPPDSAEFWYERRLIARQALAAGNPKLAYRAAAGYTHGPEGRVVDANFHAGWIALALLHDPKVALPHLERMASLSTLPETITASNYWLGRAYKALGDSADAHKHFAVAGRCSGLYYGQLAREAEGLAPVAIRGLPDWRQSAAAFDDRDLVRAVHLLAENDQAQMAEPLVRRLGYQISTPGDFVLAARLAQSIGAHDAAILIADRAINKGIPLDLFHFPLDGIPETARLADIDNAAVYAIARQESRFDVGAISRSGARGLMQLMPGTAKDVAKKAGLSYSASRLTSDPHYNLLLGSTYLAGQLQRYDGSLLLAAAAYNAGAGNVNKWIKIYGDPRTGQIDPVTFIEMIPFTETRKYVQHVMGNYLVYRARMGDRVLAPTEALKRIPS